MIEASAAHGKEVDDLPPPGTLDVSGAYGKRMVWRTFRAFSQVQVSLMVPYIQLPLP